MPRAVPTSLPGVVVIEPDVHADNRGFFLETYHAPKFGGLGITLPFVQDNHSRSAQGALRGIHLQSATPQGKLIRVVRGEILDVAIDLRVGSPTFGRWVSIELSEHNFREFYIPPGFGHAFYVSQGPADVEYKCTAIYDPADEVGVIWNDPQLAIAWPDAEPILSARDRSLPSLAQVRHRLPTLDRALASQP